MPRWVAPDAPVSYVVDSELTSPKWGEAFARGCRGRVSRSGGLEPGDVAMFGSSKLWHILRQARQESRTWYYADHAYFGRGRYYRVTKNAFQHPGTGESSGQRFHFLQQRGHAPVVLPWKKDGRHIVVCPNSPAYFELFGLNVDAWLDHVTKTLKKHTDREIRLRWKRDSKEGNPLENDLEGAWAVVAYTSNAAVEAMAAGIPQFTTGEHAAAYRMGKSDLSEIEDPYYPEDRQEFFNVLADNQWTLFEMRDGFAWHHISGEAARAMG